MKSMKAHGLWLFQFWAYHFCLVLIGLIFLLGSPVTLFIRILLPREQGIRCSRQITSRAFRQYLALCQGFGLMRLNLTALDALNDQSPMVIAPNHPSLIDVVLVMSRLRNCSCVAKNSLICHPILGMSARANNYISNAQLVPMLKKAIDAIALGAHVLIFPEGTRTRLNNQDKVNPLTGSACIIAKRAHTRVQMVYLQSNSAFLGAQWSMLRLPQFPIEYTAHLGPIIEPNEDLSLSLEKMTSAYALHLALSKA